MNRKADGFFYDSRNMKTQHAANRILTIVKSLVPEFERVVDVGCGVGTWLNVAKTLGAKVVQGVEGEWVNQSDLVIESSEILVHDFESSKSFKVARSYDLTVSLEVAEHVSCLLYTSPSPRDQRGSRMPSSA